MGGKTSTSTSQVQIPQDVLDRYNAVNATAQQVAQTPFQQYSTNPNAFVAPMTATQNAGVANTNAASGMAQPYYNAATGFALAGSNAVNPSALDTGAINQYMNPYLQSVLGATSAQINQNNQQAQAGQLGNAITSGAFGGDRSGIAAAVLAGQQQLAAGQTYSGIASDAYTNALATAQQQQQTQLGAAQANRAALQQTGSTLAGLGTGAQGAALEGAQAQLGAGQVEQQTQQAGLTALYNQFLQEQSYPFQTAQFLANIAEGTGALSGSTTTQTTPGGLFSDERLKEDMIPVGRGFDGANIYRFRYKGDPTVRLGFSAQEIERIHPEAVFTHPSGFKMVDYGRATADSAGFAMAANDDWDEDDEPRRMRAAGGRVARQSGGMSEWGAYPTGTNPMVIAQLLEAQAQMYGPYSGQGGPGLYGSSAKAAPHGGSSYVPAATLPVGQLQIARAPVAPPPGGLAQDIHQVAGMASDIQGLQSDAHAVHQGYDAVKGWLSGGQGGGSGGGSASYSGDEDVNRNQGGRIGRAAGGPTAADYAAQAHQYMNEAKIHAAAAAAHRDMAMRTARDNAAARAAAQPDTSIGGRGSILGATGLPAAYHGAHVLADAIQAGKQGIQNAGAAAAPYVQAGMAGIGNWAANQPWLSAHPAGWKPSQPWNTDPNAYRPQAPAAPAAPAPAAPHPGAAPAAPPAAAAPAVHPAVQHAIRAAQHQQLANQHAQAAQTLSAPTASAPGQASPNLAGDAGRGLPTNTSAPVIPINVGDTSHLQGGFSSANITPYHEGLFQRIGDWFGGHFGSDAQREAYDARGMNTAPPITSEAGRAPSPDMGLTHDQWLAGASPTPAPAPAAVAPQSTEPIRSEAFNDPARHPVAIDPGIDANPVLQTARGGFARAAGGAAHPQSAVASGSTNLVARASRQDGGDINPYGSPYGTPGEPGGPTGRGLNIPTQSGAAPKLATAPAPGGGGGGSSTLGQLGGMAGDVSSIIGAGKAIGSIPGVSGALSGLGSTLGGALGLGGAGAGLAAGAGAGAAAAGAGIGAGASGLAALAPLLLLANRGGRVPRADGGDTDPYDPKGPQLDIPDDSPHQQLAVAQPQKSGSGGDSTMNDIMDIAKIAQMAASFAARGGRIGRDDGGPVPDPDTPAPAIHDPKATPAAAAADADQAPPPPPPSKQGLAAAAQPQAPGGGGFGGLLSGLLHGAEGVVGYNPATHNWNRDQFTSFATGLADMLAAPTKYPLVALTQGLKGGAQQYMASQQQEAQMEQEQASAQLQRFQAQPLAQQAGMVEMPGIATNPDGSINQDLTRQIRPGMFRRLGYPGDSAAGAAPQAGVAGSPGSAGAGVQTKPVISAPVMQVDYDHGNRATWTPGQAAEAGLQAAGLRTDSGPGASMQNMRTLAMRPGLAAQAKAGEDSIAENSKSQNDALNAAPQLQMLGQAINAMPPGGIAAMGENYPERIQFIRTLQTARRMLGLGDDPELNHDLTPADIAAKVTAITGTTLAHQTDQRSADIAHALQAVLPGGSSSNVEAANHILANLIQQNQRVLDYGQYARAYVAKYGTAYGVQQAFQDEMSPTYAKEMPMLEKAMARNGRPQSIAEYIEKNPGRLKDLEQGVGRAQGFGTNFGRYFPATGA